MWRWNFWCTCMWNIIISVLSVTTRCHRVFTVHRCKCVRNLEGKASTTLFLSDSYSNWLLCRLNRNRIINTVTFVLSLSILIYSIYSTYTQHVWLINHWSKVTNYIYLSTLQLQDTLLMFFHFMILYTFTPQHSSDSFSCFSSSG